VSKFHAVVLAAAAALAMIHVDVADAARLGGGRSLGMQRSFTPPATRSAPSTGSTMSGPAANPVMPAAPAASAARSSAAAPAAAAATRSGASRWLGPIAGLAAGLGLAALFSHLGLSEGLGSLLLIGLLVVGAIALLRAFAARRLAPTPAGAYPYAANADPTAAARRDSTHSADAAIAPAWGTAAGDGAAGRYPPGFEPAPFVAQAKEQFRRLQAAYDRGDATLLADVTTPAMLAEIRRDLASRAAQTPTEVVALDAEVLEVQREGAQYVASLRFHGSLREDGAAMPQAFDEVWNLVKPVDGSSGWLLAGIQQYA